MRRWALRLLLVVLTLGVAGELFARYRLGLGDPPLLQTDPQIEYLYQPSRSYTRFGNTVAFNRWSMRSDDFPEQKAPDELRILVIGDSVVNGGAQTDQNDLATHIMQRDLPSRLGNRTVNVGNISAGSWGPMNMLAYVKKYGFFHADIVIIVLSSHDWSDVPTFGDLPVDFPTSKPVLALQEAVERYLPRYLPVWLGGTAGAPADPAPLVSADDPNVHRSLEALRELIVLAQQSGARVALAEHLERDETMDRLMPGHAPIANVAKAAGATVIQLGPSFAQARLAGEEPYRDNIHPNALGQLVIARTLMDWIVAATRNSSAPASAPS